MKRHAILHALFIALLWLLLLNRARGQTLLNSPVDISEDFSQPLNTYFLPEKLAQFDAESHSGLLRYRRARMAPQFAFNNMSEGMEFILPNEFPSKVYAADPELPFAIDFISASVVRLRLKTSATTQPARQSLMLSGPVVDDGSWKGEKTKDGYRYKSSSGELLVKENPWQLELRDSSGKTLTRTLATRSAAPFGFIRRAKDYSRSFSAVFSIMPGEKYFGCGESFGQFDKRGQKVVCYSTDTYSTERPVMYKPIPFFLSNRGYGMFVHTSAPLTFDFGATNEGRNVMYVGDDELDLFIFLGKPKEIIERYTTLTGKATMPPLWSFGLWMSRITYKSEKEVRDVAAKLRSNRIPCDVIHLDTGWFENDWQCDYQFSKTRFANPQKMIDDLKQNGFHISLWQLPYFVPSNPLFAEILRKGLAVKDAKGNLPGEDAVLDFSNPQTVKWYQAKLESLLKMGVGAIKTDFGEAAPASGLYASGATGFYEHNLYPLRYQQAAAEVTRAVTGDNIIWARAAWAGAQRNGVHWGGDAGKTHSAMAGELRGGLSLGICGFTFWSHDIGGFAGKNDVEVFRHWAPFGILSSHSRVHGEPPKEPWEFGDAFLNEFRADVELRYRLMPYIYAQAQDSASHGLPMVRALFIEYPEDPGSWLVDDEYLFGTSILVAPLFEAGATGREVYLPPGKWIDYQTANAYAGGWQHIEAGALPVIMLVRDGSILPRIALAQSTHDLDWTKLELTVFASEATEAHGLICLPDDKKLQSVLAHMENGTCSLAASPLTDQVHFTITRPVAVP